MALFASNRIASRLEKAEARHVLTGRERLLPQHELIVSKTDRRGVITYANDVFIRMCGYTEAELLGQPHSIIRHPHMPRCVFKLLWDTIEAGQEIFAYVINRAKNGDHYWVFAHVTPDISPAGECIGYHSSRRAPRREPIDALYPIYKALCEQETSIGGRAGMDAAMKTLTDTLAAKGVTYEEFALSL